MIFEKLLYFLALLKSLAMAEVFEIIVIKLIQIKYPFKYLYLQYINAKLK